MGKTVSCGDSSAAESGYIANSGVSTQDLKGYWDKLFWVNKSVAKTVIELEDPDTLNAVVAAGEGFFVGTGSMTDTSTESTFFEDAQLGIKVEQTPKILSVDFQLNMCACTSAEFEKLENKSGAFYLQTSTNQLIAVDEDGLGKGLEYSSIVVNSTIPTSDTPVEYTVLSITFSNYKKFRANPFRINLDYSFDDIDKVFSAQGSASAVSDDGNDTTFTLSVKKDCTSESLSGLVLADLSATDANGANVAITSVTPSGDNYTLVLPGTGTFYVSSNAIINKSDILYYMDAVTVKVTT